MIYVMRSIMDYARAWRLRYGHPPKVQWGQSLDTMPVGKSGYISEVVVDADGHPFAPRQATVLPDPGFNAVPPAGADRPAEPPAPYQFVERVSDDEYDLTIWRGHGLRASGDQASADAVRFHALFAAPNLAHPHHRRVPVERLQLDEEEPPVQYWRPGIS